MKYSPKIFNFTAWPVCIFSKKKRTAECWGEIKVNCPWSPLLEDVFRNNGWLILYVENATVDLLSNLLTWHIPPSKNPTHICCEPWLAHVKSAAQAQYTSGINVFWSSDHKWTALQRVCDHTWQCLVFGSQVETHLPALYANNLTCTSFTLSKIKCIAGNCKEKKKKSKITQAMRSWQIHLHLLLLPIATV